MPFQLAHIPLHERERLVITAGSEITLRAFQPVVWVRLVPWVSLPHTEAMTFPAEVDTGNNHSFLIPGPLFRARTGVDQGGVTSNRQLIVNGLPIPCYGFNLDLVRLRDDKPTERIAARLQTGQGIAVIPDALVSRFPWLPVQGVRCLTVNRIRFSLSGDRRTFSLKQPG